MGARRRLRGVRLHLMSNIVELRSPTPRTPTPDTPIPTTRLSYTHFCSTVSFDVDLMLQILPFSLSEFLMDEQRMEFDVGDTLLLVHLFRSNFRLVSFFHVLLGWRHPPAKCTFRN